MESQFVKYIIELKRAMFTGPVSLELIAESEAELAVKFAPEYIEFLKYFGNMMYKHNEILGLNPEHFDDCVSYTKEAREEDETIDVDKYVVSSAGIDGVLFLQAPDGGIYQHYPFSQSRKVASSLEDFIRSFR